ncbi:ABC transporter ATP-binding protein [Pelagibacterium xiamenense]|uniref:ABC transporter ATP-binding protein n=1 Tax=Pelagibacterium xiamenense TaxID=2901140 RepID=UPI001E58782F|nr:ABC transporter ATP-binding protein [Pelagibacterium xiamenense]MCD7059571.1 ABC transporter ATP-binding protein [Pelagibacterium xiamenense]
MSVSVSPALAINVRNVSKRFGRVLALDDVNLSVPEGNVLALVGPNGAGKSTLIDILCTIGKPDSGHVEVSGIDAVRHPLKARQKLGVVFQEPTLDTRLTVRENLTFHGMVYQMCRSERRARADAVLELVELADWGNAVTRTLSSGMRRRLEIARALMHEPRILFLDEPTIGLDAQSRAKIWSYLETLRDTQGLTLIVTTHYIDEVEGSDAVYIIDHGKILACGAPDALKADYGRTLLKVSPRGEMVRATLVKRYPDAVETADGQLLIAIDQTVSADALLAELGTQLRGISVEQPSLESVFLSLTGRDLRDAPTGTSNGTRNA